MAGDDTRPPGHPRALRAERAAERAAMRAIPPVRDADFAHLSLADLRSYRQQVTEEEGRVSYWRRILQARLDLITQGDDVPESDRRFLKPALSSGRVSAGRNALVPILPVDQVPPLPDLAALWERSVDPSDAGAHAALVRELQAAESELSDYRSYLHHRHHTATQELIARYHENPALCLDVLGVETSNEGKM